MEKGQKVLVRPQAYPMAVWPGVIVKAAKRPGFFKVKYCSYGVFFCEQFAGPRLEAIEDFGDFYGPKLVEILEEALGV